jgi:3-deoxy-D-manno-octulosonic-acid transferase
MGYGTGKGLPMPYLLDAAYLLGLLALAPWLLVKALTTGKYRRGLWPKLTGHAPLCDGSRPVAWFHGVSVGEIHLLRQVVSAFRRRHPGWECVISTTTDTGLAEARKRFPDLHVFFWPLDFSWAVGRALRRVRPDLVVLAEGELWPNFLLAARAHGVPVAVINGRMSPRSCRRYRAAGRLVRGLFAGVDRIAAQTEEYAANYRALGALPERVSVTGNVKYDGVEMDRDNPRTRELRSLLGIDPGGRVWIAGSTQAPEEEIALDIFARLRADYPNLRLLLVPRQKERFDEVAALLRRSGVAFERRSELSSGSQVVRGVLGSPGRVFEPGDAAQAEQRSEPRRGGGPTTGPGFRRPSGARIGFNASSIPGLEDSPGATIRRPSGAHPPGLADSPGANLRRPSGATEGSPDCLSQHPVILVDTIGELGALWGLADVAFVGGSLDGRRGGQNMIEPAAYGAAVVFGPHVWNFRDTAERLVAAGAAVQIEDRQELEAAVRRLLEDGAERARLGSAARRFVLQQQGATDRTLDVLDGLLHGRPGRREVA